MLEESCFLSSRNFSSMEVLLGCSFLVSIPKLKNMFMLAFFLIAEVLREKSGDSLTSGFGFTSLAYGDYLVPNFN